MTPQELELKVHEVVAAVLGGGTWEDDLVELKRELPNPAKAARRLAAHANTAHGHPIVWLVGIDESTHTLTGSPPEEFSVWHSQVQSRFHGPPPRLTRQQLIATEHVEGMPVLALAFDTDEAPYMVPPESPGSVQLEIPWRDGTVTRTAKRSEVLRVLIPSVLVPEVEPLSFTADIWRKEDRTELHLAGRLLFLPRSTDLLFLPAHRVQAELVLYSGLAPAARWPLPAADLDWGDKVYVGDHVRRMPQQEPKYETAFCWAQTDGIYLTAPGSVPVRYRTLTFQTDVKLEAFSSIELRMRIPVASTDHAIHLLFTMQPAITSDGDNPDRFSYTLQ